MNSSGLLSLTWNKHTSTLINSLQNIRLQTSLCDATLICEGRHVPVHKFVLSACAEYFQEIFAATPCKHPFIILKDISNLELESLLDYMYCGRANILQERLPHFLEVADSLKVKGLAVSDDGFSLVTIVPVVSIDPPNKDNVDKESATKPTPAFNEYIKSTKKNTYSFFTHGKDNYSPEDSIIEHKQKSVRDLAMKKEVFKDCDLKRKKMNNQICIEEAVQHLKPVVVLERNIKMIKSLPVLCKSTLMNEKVNKSEAIPSQWSADMEDSDVSSKSAPKADSIALFTDKKESAALFNKQSLKMDGMFTKRNKAKYPSSLLSRRKMLHFGRMPYKCGLCPYGARNKQTLARHAQTHIKQTKIAYKCFKCPFRAYLMSSLRNHERKHGKENVMKRLNCTLCPYTSTEDTQLQSHLMSHAGQKLFVCAYCSHKTMSADLLQGHVIAEHTPDLEFA